MNYQSLSRVALLTLFAAGAGACGDGTSSDTVDVFSAAEFTKIKTFGPLGGPPASPTNRFADDDKAATFGQMIFFEKAFAGALTVGNDGTNGSAGAVGETGKLACASCHDPNNWFVDTRSNPNATSL